MFLKPAKLGEKEIPESILSEDKKHCKKIGPCGIGKEALYLNSFYLERRFYIPVSSVSRVFKRVAMSKGGFTGKGLFATMPYLVVVYEDGKEKQCNFKYEDQVDAFVASVKERFPQIKPFRQAAAPPEGRRYRGLLRLLLFLRLRRLRFPAALCRK